MPTNAPVPPHAVVGVGGNGPSNSSPRGRIQRQQGSNIRSRALPVFNTAPKSEFEQFLQTVVRADPPFARNLKLEGPDSNSEIDTSIDAALKEALGDLNPYHNLAAAKPQSRQPTPDHTKVRNFLLPWEKVENRLTFAQFHSERVAAMRDLQSTRITPNSTHRPRNRVALDSTHYQDYCQLCFFYGYQPFETDQNWMDHWLQLVQAMGQKMKKKSQNAGWQTLPTHWQDRASQLHMDQYGSAATGTGGATTGTGGATRLTPPAIQQVGASEASEASEAEAEAEAEPVQAPAVSSPAGAGAGGAANHFHVDELPHHDEEVVNNALALPGSTVCSTVVTPMHHGHSEMNADAPLFPLDSVHASLVPRDSTQGSAAGSRAESQKHHTTSEVLDSLDQFHSTSTREDLHCQHHTEGNVPRYDDCVLHIMEDFWKVAWKVGVLNRISYKEFKCIHHNIARVWKPAAAPAAATTATTAAAASPLHASAALRKTSSVDIDDEVVVGRVRRQVKVLWTKYVHRGGAAATRLHMNKFAFFEYLYYVGCEGQDFTEPSELADELKRLYDRIVSRKPFLDWKRIHMVSCALASEHASFHAVPSEHGSYPLPLEPQHGSDPSEPSEPWEPHSGGPTQHGSGATEPAEPQEPQPQREPILDAYGRVDWSSYMGVVRDDRIDVAFQAEVDALRDLCEFFGIQPDDFSNKKANKVKKLARQSIAELYMMKGPLGSFGRKSSIPLNILQTEPKLLEHERQESSHVMPPMPFGWAINADQLRLLASSPPVPLTSLKKLVFRLGARHDPLLPLFEEPEDLIHAVLVIFNPNEISKKHYGQDMKPESHRHLYDCRRLERTQCEALSQFLTSSASELIVRWRGGPLFTQQEWDDVFELSNTFDVYMIIHDMITRGTKFKSGASLVRAFHSIAARILELESLAGETANQVTGEEATIRTFIGDALCMRLIQYAKEQRLRTRDVFIRFDFDASGGFDATEIYDMLQICNIMGDDRQVTLADARCLMQAVDFDSDGMISLKELEEGLKRYMHTDPERKKMLLTCNIPLCPVDVNQEPDPVVSTNRLSNSRAQASMERTNKFKEQHAQRKAKSRDKKLKAVKEKRRSEEKPDAKAEVTERDDEQHSDSPRTVKPATQANQASQAMHEPKHSSHDATLAHFPTLKAHIEVLNRRSEEAYALEQMALAKKDVILAVDVKAQPNRLEEIINTLSAKGGVAVGSFATMAVNKLRTLKRNNHNSDKDSGDNGHGHDLHTGMEDQEAAMLKQLDRERRLKLDAFSRHMSIMRIEHREVHQHHAGDDAGDHHQHQQHPTQHKLVVGGVLPDLSHASQQHAKDSDSFRQYAAHTARQPAKPKSYFVSALTNKGTRGALRNGAATSRKDVRPDIRPIIRRHETRSQRSSGPWEPPQLNMTSAHPPLGELNENSC